MLAEEADRLIEQAAQPDIPALFALAEKIARITDGLDMLGGFLTQALAERIRARALGGQPASGPLGRRAGEAEQEFRAHRRAASRSAPDSAHARRAK